MLNSERARDGKNEASLSSLDSAFSIQHSAFSISPAPRFLRYVVLYHEGIAEPHFDLMFETLPGSDLATWRSPCWPIAVPTVLRRLKDHRRMYLDYVGELSGHRGRVEQVARGECTIEVGEDAIWMIQLLAGWEPACLVLTSTDGEFWEGRITSRL